METSNIPILLADSHTCSRIGLNQVLTEVGFMVVADVESADDLWQQLDEYPLPFLLLLAHNLLPENPISFIFNLIQQYPNCQTVLLLDNCNDDLPLQPLLDSGLSGMIAKKESMHTLMWVIQSVTAGQRAISPLMMDRLLQINLKTQITLDESERQLLMLVCAEKTNLEIATALNISRKTVE